MTASLLMGLFGCGDSKRPPPAPPPPMVLVAPVVRQNVPLYIEAVSTLDGYVNADVRARVRGYLRSQNYKDGSPVRAGDLLFTIEPTEYAAAVTSARAGLTRARVARDRNKIQLDRDEGLLKSGMISQQDLDDAAAKLADTEGQVLAAEAQLQTAELNFSYTQIRSTIDGVAGLALVRVGNLVGQDGPTLLTTVSQIDPIRVNFTMSEVDYVRHPERFKHLEARNLAWVKKELASLDGNPAANGNESPLELTLSDGSLYPHRGVIVTINRQVDVSTGTIQVQALVGNPDGLLRPGQFARVRIKRAEAGHDVLSVPDKALVSVQGTFSVAVVGPDDKVHLRRVDLGPNAHGVQIIDHGVTEGDRVVVEGVQKATDGATVDPRPAPQAGALASPPAQPTGARAAAANE
ncbi:MAG: efflux RND transporter periplasmic adaptor subunit [Polyangiaceae bacterium]